jgi:hypothetical protein
MMSVTATRSSRLSRQSCESCRERKARFRHRGAVRADRDHTLCFACFRAQRERVRARALDRQALLPLEVAPPPTVIGQSPALTDRQLEHRQRMLAHLVRVQAERRSAV